MLKTSERTSGAIIPGRQGLDHKVWTYLQGFY
jgi:hypothetical protein